MIPPEKDCSPGITQRTCWIVCGSRTFTDYEMMKTYLDALADEYGPPTVLVNGAMAGADALSSYWAYERKINTLAYGAMWGTYGGSAGPRRNADMAQQLSADSGRDICAAFTDKPLATSRGTKDMVGKATAILGGKRVFVFEEGVSP